MAQEIVGLNASTGALEILKSTNQMLLPYDFQTAVSRGKVPGHSPVYIFGFTVTLGSTAYGPCWEGLTPSGGSYVYPPTAQVMKLVSTSAGDTGVSIFINGLDSSFNILTETVALNGTTPVLSSGSYLRINSITTTLGNAAGNVTLVGNVSTVLYAEILAGNGNSQASIYTVPNGYTFYNTYLQADANTSATSSGYNKVRTISQPAISGIGTTLLQSVFVQAFNVPLQFPVSIPQKTDIQWQLLASAGTNTAANVYAGGFLVSNAV